MDHEELMDHVLEAYRNPASTFRDRADAYAALKGILDRLDKCEAALRAISEIDVSREVTYDMASREMKKIALDALEA
jgi:hypothetical protein